MELRNKHMERGRVTHTQGGQGDRERYTKWGRNEGERAYNSSIQDVDAGSLKVQYQQELHCDTLPQKKKRTSKKQN